MFAVFVVNTLYIKSLSFSSSNPCSHPFSTYNIYYMSVSLGRRIFPPLLLLYSFLLPVNGGFCGVVPSPDGAYED